MDEKDLDKDILIKLFNEIRLIEGKGLRIGKDDDFMRIRIEKLINKAVLEEKQDEI